MTKIRFDQNKFDQNKIQPKRPVPTQQWGLASLKFCDNRCTFTIECMLTQKAPFYEEKVFDILKLQSLLLASNEQSDNFPFTPFHYLNLKCVSPSSLFSGKTGAFCSFVCLKIYFCKQEPQLASQKIASYS